ncbi:MAG: hypothetical protein ABIH76_00325 [Candidatus Bathyarchaeota archaeon]
MEYTTVGLPKSFAERFHDIMSFFGYRTFSEFVVETVRQRLQEMENIHEIKSMEKDDHE